MKHNYDPNQSLPLVCVSFHSEQEAQKPQNANQFLFSSWVPEYQRGVSLRSRLARAFSQVKAQYIVYDRSLSTVVSTVKESYTS